MNEKPNQEEYAAFYEGYIHLVPEGNVIELLQKQAERVETVIRSLSEEQASYRYGQDKWSVKEVFGHLIDNERIMSARLLRIARGDNTSLPGYDQDILMQNAPFETYSVIDLAEEYAAVRYSTIVLLRRLRPDAWMRKGRVNDYTASTRSIAYVITGHELHHLSVLRDRYDVQI